MYNGAAMPSAAAHRLAALAWSGVLGAVFVAVASLWLLLLPLAVTAELLFRVHLGARVRKLAALKAHVPASLRVRHSCHRPSRRADAL